MIRALLALLLLGAEVRAETAALEVTPCDGVAVIEVQQALTLELFGEGVTLVLDGAPANAVHLRLRWVDCAGAKVEIELDDRQHATRTIKTVDLADVAPEQRLRALGLATAELYRALVLERPTPIIVVPPTTTIVTPPPIVVDRDEAGTALGLSLVVTSWPGSELALLGPRMDLVGAPFDAPIGLRVGLGAGFASTDAALGSVDTVSFDGFVGVDLRGSTASITWSVGPRLMGGALSFDGTTSSPDFAGASGYALVLALGLGGELAMAIAPDVHGDSSAYVSLGLDLGMTLVGARAVMDQQVLVDASGPRLGIALGFGWRP